MIGIAKSIAVAPDVIEDLDCRISESAPERTDHVMSRSGAGRGKTRCWVLTITSQI